MKMTDIEKSFLYQLDPRTKMVMMIGLIFIGVMIKDPFITTGFMVLIYALYRVSGVPAKTIAKNTKPLLLAFVLFFLLNFPFAEPEVGEPVYFYIFSKGGIAVTATGILTGLGNGLKFILFIWIADLITTMTPTGDIILALNKGGVPPEISIAIGIAFSYIPVLKNEIGTIIEAQKSRGASFESKNVFKKIKAYVPVIVPGLFISLLKGKEISRAIEARGFTYAPENRTYRNEISLKMKDVVIIFIIIGFLAGFIYMSKNYPFLERKFVFNLLFS
ncbi:MAG: energy-coupling factor transporter transmembrane protein EcfT [Lachnospiraceae bacterium]|jgi:energy-coupling factor transport system permease protein|nr:energy-coupling factor transporter transmembrane protein EcfT [Lachnospiraceae bacterium]